MSSTLARPEILALKPYVTAIQKPGMLRLNANEAASSPLNDGLNRYPQIRADDLQKKLAAVFGVSKQNLLATRGSSEAIDLVMRAFCRAYEDSILVMPPTFSMYQVYADMQGATKIEVALNPDNDFQLDAKKVLANCTDNCKLIFICSPNNPTGGSVPFSDIKKLLRAREGKSLIVVDEAYIEFSGTDSVAGQLEQFDNLVVLRTLSKAWGLAGTRCGAVISNPTIIEILARLVPPYAFSTPSSDRVLQSLSRVGESNARKLIATTIAERERMRGALLKLSSVTRVWPSDSNFLLTEFGSLALVQEQLAQSNVLVRAFGDSPLLANSARITIGTADQNDLLLKVLGDASGSRP